MAARRPFSATEGVAEGEWYRLVTSMFAHQEIWHIGFNMLSLWWLGGPLEAALGRARYLALYFVSGLAGSALAYLLASPSTATLGASGAIFGLFGATAVLMRRLNYDLRPIIALLVINLIFTFGMEQHLLAGPHRRPRRRRDHGLRDGARPARAPRPGAVRHLCAGPGGRRGHDAAEDAPSSPERSPVVHSAWRILCMQCGNSCAPCH